MQPRRGCGRRGGSARDGGGDSARRGAVPWVAMLLLLTMLIAISVLEQRRLALPFAERRVFVY